MAKLALGIRVGKDPDSMFFRSLTLFLTQNRIPNVMLLPPIYGLPFHVAANQVVDKFLTTTYDNLLFIDDDMVFKVDDVVKIKKDIEDELNKDYGIIGGLYPTRRGKICPLAIYNDNGVWKASTLSLIDGINNVDGVGLGFTIIRRKCFELPVFKNNIFFDMKDNQGEDIYFCERVKEAGFKIGLDTRINLGHRGMFSIYWNLKDDKPEIRSTDPFGQEV